MCDILGRSQGLFVDQEVTGSSPVRRPGLADWIERYSVGKVLFEARRRCYYPVEAAAGFPLLRVGWSGGVRLPLAFFLGVEPGQVLVNGAAHQFRLRCAGAFDGVGPACELAFLQVQGDSSQQWHFSLLLCVSIRLLAYK